MVIYCTFGTIPVKRQIMHSAETKYKVLSICAVSSLLLLSMLIGTVEARDDHPIGEKVVAMEVNEDIPTREGEYQIPLINGLEYLAIGPAEFTDIMAPLIEWKTNKGVKAVYMPLYGPEGILEPENEPRGRDKPEQIRSFIYAMWENHEETLKWILLVGDGEIIPMRKTFVNGTYDPGVDNEKNFVLTDYYYADLEGTWDDYSRNDVFGEEGEIEWNPNVYVGRFPASNVEELSIMVDRQLGYEIDPPVGSWARSTLLAGSLMDRPNIRDNIDTTMVDEGYNDYKDNGYEVVTKVDDLLPDNVTSYILADYPQTQYGGYSQLFDTLNRSTFESYFEMGFSTALLVCHGDSNGNCTEYRGDGGGALPYWLDEESYFDYEMAETIENGRRVPLVYISNCDSLNFSEEDDTNMERLLGNQNGGAIGLIGASTTTYRGEYYDGGSYGNWWLARKFFELLYNVTSHPAQALYMQKAAYENYIWEVRDYTIEEFRMHRIDNLAYNLLGDPEGPIWLDVPRTFSASLPTPYDQDNNTFRVEVYDEATGLPVEGARITLIDPSDPELYIRENTDERGVAEFILIRESLDPLSITIDHPGYVPLIKEVEVVSYRNVELLPEMILDPAIPCEGQDLNVHLRVRNSGLVDLYNFVVTLNISKVAPEGRYLKTKDDLPRPIPILKVNQTMDLNFTFPPSYLLSGSSIIMAEVSPPYMPSHVLIESDTTDNVLERMVRVNDPLYFQGTIPNQLLKEDTPLSLDPGTLDLSPYLWDNDDFPEVPIKAWVSDVQGGFDAGITGMELDIIPHTDWNGNGTLNVTASDGSTYDTRTIYVKVGAVNDPPEFFCCPETLTVSEDHTTNFTVILWDIDSESLTLESNLMDLKIRDHEKITKGFNISISPDDDLVGESLITFTAYDDEGLNVTYIMRLEVTQTNDPPTFEDIPQVNCTQGSSKLIELEIWDVDLDVDFTIYMEWDKYNHTSNSTSFLYKVPSDAKPGIYKVQAWVTDEHGATTTGSFMLLVEAKDDSVLNSYIFAMIVVVMVMIVLYGAFIKIQEKRQKEVVEQVGTNRPLEARALSKETFEEEEDKAIAAPPVPTDIEGDIARKMQDGEESTDPSHPHRGVRSDSDESVDSSNPRRSVGSDSDESVDLSNPRGGDETDVSSNPRGINKSVDLSNPRRSVGSDSDESVDSSNLRGSVHSGTNETGVSSYLRGSIRSDDDIIVLSPPMAEVPTLLADDLDELADDLFDD